jgi:carbon monoxide dehydrogenase subunit G
MARYVATLETPRTQEDVFAYLSDFSTTQEWDPGVAEAQRLDDGPIAVGSRFNVVADFMGRRTPLVYAVVALDAPHSITLRGENATVVSLDTIAFEPTPGGGTRISYDADLTLKGPLRLGDPLLKLVFNRIGDRAVDGLRAQLGA